MFTINFNNNEYPDESCIVASFETLDKAVEHAFEYLDDKFEGDFDGDSEESIKDALTLRRFYVIGYGDSDITIEETI